MIIAVAVAVGVAWIKVILVDLVIVLIVSWVVESIGNRSSSSSSIRSQCSRRCRSRRSRDDSMMSPSHHRSLPDSESVNLATSLCRRRCSVHLSHDDAVSRTVALSVDSSTDNDPIGPSSRSQVTVPILGNAPVPHTIHAIPNDAKYTPGLPLPIFLQLLKILLRMRPDLNRCSRLDVLRHLFPLLAVEFQPGEEEFVFFLGPASGVFGSGFDEFAGGGGRARCGWDGCGGGGGGCGCGSGEEAFGLLWVLEVEV